MIDEIKCIYSDLKYRRMWTWSTCPENKCYAYFLACDRELAAARRADHLLQHRASEEVRRRFRFDYLPLRSLRSAVLGLVHEYEVGQVPVFHGLRRQQLLKRFAVSTPTGMSEYCRCGLPQHRPGTKPVSSRRPPAQGKTLSTVFQPQGNGGRHQGINLFVSDGQEHHPQRGRGRLSRCGPSSSISARHRDHHGKGKAVCVLDKPDRNRRPVRWPRGTTTG